MDSAYTLLTSESAYRQACDTVLGLVRSELLIFDRDLVMPKFETTARLDTLTALLQSGGARGLRVVVHDPGPLTRDAPRLLQLVARWAHRIEVRQSPDNLRHLTDTHIIADGVHGVRRFHVDQPRSALVVDDGNYLQPWLMRFEELWELSQPCLALNSTGL